ncbi:DEHA2B10098p [Debaryomyces hansenii CBS767]|uniref:Stress-associated endoplasmic reticulum protein n=1 Tax=Debaryomyces hansenii (strain ATCC 36239 / CBS 767 / BCRC 21394 / JCM 1990 / NBRC 0083 / IGC 2968) TaxID=284592 RepID=Q6BWM8_DEBHA|nr:DEHA2B10098p [Debaryomyces hansenii CBS767]CAG85395.1 DEHA2B10098p [Debaryomyces hansenii CBS767]|eukprot:XP_457391.1 DEHA2B10098p [Debaryomyces hansenii CBS767]
MAQQTPKQRAANAKWAKQNTKKQGQPRKEGKKSEFPVSRTWLLVLLFLVCGGAILELIRMFF